MWVLVVVLVSLLSQVIMMESVVEQDLAMTRVTMTQQQSCYYQPHTQQLVCQCMLGEDKSHLHLRLGEFIIQAGQQIRSILIHSCPDLLLHLDFTGVNTNPIETVIKNSQNILLEAITMDQKYKNRQQIKMEFLNIGRTTLASLSISEAAKMKVTNVKEFLVLNCSFAHIPMGGLVVSRTDKLVIQDSTFSRVYPQSMVLEKTRVVEVVNNQFSVEAIQVISYKEGSSVFISCNRLLGEFIKPECFTTTIVSTTTMRTTTTATTSTSTPLPTSKALPSSAPPPQSHLVTILLILISILLIVMGLVIAAICFTHWAKIKKELTQLLSLPPDPEQEDAEQPLHVVAVPAPPPPPPPVEMESLLNPQNCTKQQLFAPVWMDEIHNNKIFNRQKSINQDLGSDDTIEKKDNDDDDDNKIFNKQKSINQDLEGSGEHQIDTIEKQDDDDDNADYKENSRTESDQEDI